MRNEHMRKYEDQDDEQAAALLQQMSLMSPPSTLDHAVRSMRPRRSPNISLAAATGIVCVAAGFLAGRMWPDQPSPMVGGLALNTSIAADHQDSALGSNDLAELDLALDSTAALNNREENQVRLVNEGLFLLNGKVPVRKYVARSKKIITVLDPETNTPVEMVVPVEKTVVAPSVGT